jgi:nitrite reductase (NADH) large subunit
MREKLVVVGNGMAGMRTIEELLKLEPDLYEITVFGEEPHANYNRILLSPVLAGEKRFSEIVLNDDAWYRDRGILLCKGKEIVAIDRRARTVTAADGTCTPYDRLLIATGSLPIMLPLPGRDLDGVLGFRAIADVERMLAAAERYQDAVVIGGGLLGLEAANGLMKRGMKVTVIHLLDSLMERQVDAAAARLLRQSLATRGLAFAMPAETAEIVGADRARAVRLKDGREFPADLVVMAVGIRPNIALAKKAGLYCERGIVVDSTMQSFDGRVYAVGECAQSHGKTYGLVAPLFEQAKVCANHLAQRGYARYAGSLTSTRLKVTGIDVFSAGDFAGGPDAEEIVLQDSTRGVYRKLVVRDNRIEGSVLYGDTVDGAWYFQLMRDRTDISAIRGQILFGQAQLGDSGHAGRNAAAAMTDDTEICGCNGVKKGMIVTAILANKLFTLEDVRAHTKASSSCGSCTALVQQILASTLGGDYSAPAKAKPLCRCTEYSHDEVRATIRAQELKSIGAVMAFMEWRTPDGCHVCRPALNYYLLCQWPDSYVDDKHSRFINERAHANIQKDGTFSVVPRMWGGITSSKELRTIADVVEKFAIPTVKITGGQRIDMLGVPKETLPAVWADLARAGMVSGHAYGKALRTVKTCVGSEWCRFGTQDSTSMGIALEKMTWGSWTPHKVKMAVSGCPRNCAEATIKDFGVVAVESGWELHVGGNGGVKVRATDLLCKVATAKEVLEYCGAFLQLYREEAHYLERTAPWIERVGLAYVKRRLVEDHAGRAALYERFLFAQRYAQHDPWAERGIDGVDREEFRPLTELASA